MVGLTSGEAESVRRTKVKRRLDEKSSPNLDLDLPKATALRRNRSAGAVLSLESEKRTE